MKNLRIFLVLLSNALMLGLLLLLYLDGRNPYYYGGFLASASSKIFMAVLCGVGLLTNVLFLADLRRRR